MSSDKSDDKNVGENPKDSDGSAAVVPNEGEQSGSSSSSIVPQTQPSTKTDKGSAVPSTNALLPQLKWTTKLTIASWNCGGSSDFTKDVLFVMMHIQKIDVIFIQEVKTLKFGELYNPHNEYQLIAQCDSVMVGKEKRGLLILCRVEKVSSFFNDKWNRGGLCVHGKTTEVRGGNIEYCCVDVLMESGQTRRLINIYHTSVATKNCVEAIDAMLSTLLAENCETLLIGDGNLKQGDFDKSTDFETTMSGHSMTNHLPKQWDTYFSSYGPSQPDILYSSIKNAQNLLVHKPQGPHELLTRMLSKTYTDVEITNKVQEIRNKNMSSPGTYHKVLFVEIGDEVNSGSEFICCPSVKFHCLPKEIGCKFIEQF